MNKSLVSVIVPVYKVEKYLDKCVESIVEQTYKNLEIILVDDGSPDNCPSMCDDWAARDSRIKVIHKENGGVSSARNSALDAAAGDYICFVDSDDSIDPSYYEKLHQAAVQSGAEIAIGDILYFEADGSLSGYQEKALRTEVISGDEAIHRMRLTPFIHLTTRLHRRELFDTLRFPVGKNYEDAFTTPLILEQVTKVACVGEPLYHYKFNPVGIVRTKFDFKNLNEVYANYALLECALRHGKKDTAYLQYIIMKNFARKIRRQLPPEKRNDAQVQQMEACLKKAEAEVKQAGAFTVQNWLEAELRAVNAPLYNRCKYKIRQTKPKKCR